MSLDNAKNFAKVTVSLGYDDTATSIVLTGGHGALLPTVPFNVVWWNSTDYSDPSDDPNKEIVRVTNIATDTLTVTRAQEGTAAATHNTGGKTYKMIAGLTALGANYIVAQNASGDAVGFSGIPLTFKTVDSNSAQDLSLVASSAVSGNNNGASIYIQSGYPSGSGAGGYIELQSVTGDLYFDDNEYTFQHVNSLFGFIGAGTKAILDVSDVATSDKTFTFPNATGLIEVASVFALTDGATPALDASKGSEFTLAAAGDRTIAIPSNPTDGQKIIIRHRASGGARTLSLNTAKGGFRFGSDITGLTQTASEATDYIGAIYNLSDNYWDVVAYVKGYSPISSLSPSLSPSKSPSLSPSISPSVSPT